MSTAYALSLLQSCHRQSLAGVCMPVPEAITALTPVPGQFQTSGGSRSMIVSQL